MRRSSTRRRVAGPFTGWERLEPRTLMAVINWDGGGDGVTLTQASNWAGDVLPGAADDAVISVGANPTIQHTSGTFTVRSLTSAEALSLGGGTVSVSGAGGAASTLSSLSLTSGTLTGDGDITLTGTFAWSGGTLQGAGKLILGAASTAAVTSNVSFGRNLDVGGTLTWSDGAIFTTVAGGAALTVLPGATLTINTPGQLSFTANGAQPNTLVNQGSVIKIGAGAVSFGGGAAFTNSGSLSADAGTFSLNGGGSSTGSMSVASGAVLNFDGGPFNVEAGSSLSGPGTIRVSGATATFGIALDASAVQLLAGTLTLNAASQTIGDLTLSGGALNGSGDVTVTGAFAWSGATIAGAGTLTLGAASSGAVTGNVTLGRDLDVGGALTWSGGAIFTSVAGGATLTVLSGATFTINTTGQLSFTANGAQPNTIVNQGILINAGTGSIHIAGALTNAGTLDVDAGTLSLSGGGSSTGSIDVADGGVLDLSGGSFTAQSGSSAGGAGVYRVSAGTNVFEIALNAPGGVQMLGGTLTLNAASQTFASLTHSGGTLTGSGDVTVTGTFDWSGGAIAGAGKLILGAASTLLVTSSVTFGRDLDVGGAMTWSGGAMFTSIAGGATLTVLPGGTFTINTGSQLSFTANGAQPNSVVNLGTLAKAGAGSVLFAGPLANAGTLNVNAGTLTLGGGGGNTGTMSVANVATLTLSSGTFTYGNNGTITGLGVLDVSGGTHTFTGNGAFDIVTTWSGATLNGAGTATFNLRLDWDSGTMSGAGQTVIGATSQLRLDATSSRTLSRTLVNNGVIDHSAGALIWSGGTLVNSATRKYNLTGTATFSLGSGGNVLTNAGVFNCTGAGAVVLPATLNSSGAINVFSGTLQLNGGGANTGKRNVAAGATLHYVGDYTHGAGSTLTGGGTTIWQGGTHTLSADWTAASFLHWTNITVDGPGTLSTNGPITWNSGTVQGAGGIVINAAGKLTATTTGTHQLGRDVTNNGTLIWNNGSLDFVGATITNNAGKFFFVLSGATAGAAGGAHRIVNLGTIRKQLGTALSFGDVEIDTPGAIDVRNGSVTINGASLAQLSGATLTGGDWSLLPTGDLFFTGATITTLGADASVTLLGNASSFDAISTLATNDGSLTIGGGKVFTVDPSSGPFRNNGEVICRKGSVLRVLGDFVQAATGGLSIDISAPGGSGVGRVFATGAATLDGTVTLAFVSGFTPAAGQAFSFLSASTRSGLFGSESLPAITGLTGSVQYLAGGALFRYA